MLSTCSIGWGVGDGCGSYTESPELLKEMVKQVATHIGPFARPGMIVGTPALPKTRSGKKRCLFYFLLSYDAIDGPAVLMDLMDGICCWIDIVNEEIDNWDIYTQLNRLLMQGFKRAYCSSTMSAPS